MSTLLLSAFGALGLLSPVQERESLADRAIYDGVADCAATWRISMVRAIGARDPVSQEAATVQYTAFRALTRLYGAGLDLPEIAADEVIRDRAWRKLAQAEPLSRSEASRRLRDQAHQGEEVACVALAARIAQEPAEPD